MITVYMVEPINAENKIGTFQRSGIHDRGAIIKMTRALRRFACLWWGSNPRPLVNSVMLYQLLRSVIFRNL